MSLRGKSSCTLRGADKPGYPFRADCHPEGMELRLDHDTALQLTPQEALRETSQRSRYTLFALRQDNEGPR